MTRERALVREAGVCATLCRQNLFYQEHGNRGPHADDRGTSLHATVFERGHTKAALGPTFGPPLP